MTNKYTLTALTIACLAITGCGNIDRKITESLIKLAADFRASERASPKGYVDSSILLEVLTERKCITDEYVLDPRCQNFADGFKLDNGSSCAIDPFQKACDSHVKKWATQHHMRAVRKHWCASQHKRHRLCGFSIINSEEKPFESVELAHFSIVANKYADDRWNHDEWIVSANLTTPYDVGVALDNKTDVTFIGDFRVLLLKGNEILKDYEFDNFTVTANTDTGYFRGQEHYEEHRHCRLQINGSFTPYGNLSGEAYMHNCGAGENMSARIDGRIGVGGAVGVFNGRDRINNTNYGMHGGFLVK